MHIPESVPNQPAYDTRTHSLRRRRPRALDIVSRLTVSRGGSVSSSRPTVTTPMLNYSVRTPRDHASPRYYLSDAGTGRSRCVGTRNIEICATPTRGRVPQKHPGKGGFGYSSWPRLRRKYEPRIKSISDPNPNSQINISLANLQSSPKNLKAGISPPPMYSVWESFGRMS